MAQSLRRANQDGASLRSASSGANIGMSRCSSLSACPSTSSSRGQRARRPSCVGLGGSRHRAGSVPFQVEKESEVVERQCRERRGYEHLSKMKAERLQNIEVHRAGLSKASVASRLEEKKQETTDATFAKLIREEECACAKITAEDDADFARQVANEEERRDNEAMSIEDMDVALAKRLSEEEKEHGRSIESDWELAATLQSEHGRAGKMLSRAAQIEEFLEAPFGSRPMPVNGDLFPETLQRIVAMSTAAVGKSASGKCPASSPFRTAGSSIAASSHW